MGVLLDRIDSDITDYDYSTDSESLRFFFSETDPSGKSPFTSFSTVRTGANPLSSLFGYSVSRSDNVLIVTTRSDPRHYRKETVS